MTNAEIEEERNIWPAAVLIHNPFIKPKAESPSFSSFNNIDDFKAALHTGHSCKQFMVTIN